VRISVAHETGRLAADAVDLALSTGDGLALQTYDARLAEVYGLYFKTAPVFVRAIGNPAVMRELDASACAAAHAHGVGAAHHGEPPPPDEAGRPRRVPRRRRPRTGCLEP
jgi:hypothetical protein